MKAMLIVALGGALGSVARYKLSGYVLHHTIDWRFPAGTFAVNVIGCLVAGVLAALAERHELLTPEARLLLFTGILRRLHHLLRVRARDDVPAKRGEVLVAGANIVLSVVAGLLALWLGSALGSVRA